MNDYISKESGWSEHRASKLIQRALCDNGYEVSREVRLRSKCQIDIIASGSENIYIIEIKFFRTNYVPFGILQSAVDQVRRYSCEYSNDIHSNNNVVGVIAVFNQVEPSVREAIESEPGIYLLDISNILYLIQDDDELKIQLMSLLDYSIGEIAPVHHMMFRPKTIKNLNKSGSINKNLNALKHELRMIAPGRKSEPDGEANWQRHQDICKRIFMALFVDDLECWKTQSATRNRIQIFDMICRIKGRSNQPFFSIVQNYFYSTYLLFEFKNYTNQITQKEIITTERYLFEKSLRKVAIICCRKGVDLNGQSVICGALRENGKLIIVLSDRDLEKMINFKISNKQPALYLADKVDDFLIGLER